MKKLIALAVIGLILIGAHCVMSGTVTKGLIGKEDIDLWEGTGDRTFTRTTNDGYNLTLRSIDWMGIDILDVYGYNVNQNNATISLALTAVGGTNKVGFWLAPGVWEIDDDLTITSNVTLICPPGCDLQVAAAKTLTVYEVDAGPYQIITLAAGASVTFSGSGIIYKDIWTGTDSGQVEIDSNGLVICSRGVIEGDATAGRVLRCSTFHIQPGGTPGTNVNVALEASIFNGDTDSAANLDKNETVGNWTLTADGKTLTLDAAGLTGNCIGVLSSVIYDCATTAVYTLRAYASGNDMIFKVYATDSGHVSADWLTAISGGGKHIYAQITFITDA